MYELWYDYVKPKYSEKAKLCYMYFVYRNNFIVHVKGDGQIIKELVGLRAKTYSNLKYSNDEDKKKNEKKCVIKRKLKLEDYKKMFRSSSNKEFIKSNKLLKAQQRFRSEILNVSTEKNDKIYLGSDDDKLIQSTDSIEKIANGKTKVLVCKKEEVKCSNIVKLYENL